MRSHLLPLLVVAAISLGFSGRTSAQEKSAEKAPAQAASAPTSGARAEFLEEVAYYEGRYTRLAEAMPADKYTWKPGEGVRSVGDVFAHITLANYFIARALGATLPAGIDPKTIMGASADKTKVVQSLKDSFAFFRQAILALNDSDMDKPQKMFGRQTTVRGSFIAITGHMGEHLGQSIAYARVNGIVPPWTEEAQQNQQKPAEKPKP
jgi:uncharacterized damage-inducible protein DinB